MNSSIPRGNFLVIDQFAVELFATVHPEMIHADEHLLNVFIASILGSASQGDLGTFHPLKDSLRLAAFVVEAVKDAKDDGEAELMARLANDQARSLVHFVLKELEDPLWFQALRHLRCLSEYRYRRTPIPDKIPIWK